MGNKRDKLYANLINSGKVTESEIGTREQFMAAMKDESSARRIHKNLINSGKFDENEIGNSDQFYNFISSDFSRPEQVSNPKPTQQTKPLGTPKEDKPKAKPAVTRNLNPSFASPSWGRGFNGTQLNSQEAEAKRQEAVSKANEAKNTGYPVTKKWTGDIWKQNADKLKAVEAGKQAEKEELAAKVQEEKTRQEEVDRILNGEEVPTTSTPAPEGYKPIEINYKQEGPKATPEDPFGLKARSEKIYRDSVENNKPKTPIEQMYQEIADVGEKLEQRRAEIDEERARMEEENPMLAALQNMPRHGTEMPMSFAYQNDEEYNRLMARAKALRDARHQYEASQDYKKSVNSSWSNLFNVVNNARNFAGGLKDALTNPNTFDAGYGSLNEAGKLWEIKIKSDNGEQLTDDEMDFALAEAIKNYVQQNYDTAHGYTAGQITGEMIPFMADMFINPAKGLGQGLARQAVRKFGIKGTEAIMARMAARLGGDIVSAATLAATIQNLKTSANVLGRYTGNAGYNLNDGNVEFDGLKDGENFGKALYEGFTSATIENLTEMLGGDLGLGLGSAAKRALTKKLASAAGKLKMSNVENWILGLPKSDWIKGVRSFENATQWHGSIGEMMEEEYGIILNSILTGDNEFSDLYDKDQQIDIALGVGLFGGFMSATSTVGYVGERTRAKRENEFAELHAKSYIAPDTWESMKSAIDGLDGEELKNYIKNNVIDNNSLNNTQKSAAMRYANSVMRLRGLNLAKVAGDIEGSVPQQQVEAENKAVAAIEQGETAETPEERYSIGEEYENASSALENANGGAMIKDTIDRMTAGQMGEDEYNNVMNNLSPELRPLAEDYLNATHKLTGMRNAVDRKVGESVASQQQKLRTALNITEGDIPQTIYKAEINGKTTYLINYDENSDQVYYVDDNGNVVSEFKDKIPNLAVEAVDYPAFISQYEAAERTRIEKEYNDQTMHNPKTYLNITPNNPINVTMNGENRRLIYTGQNDEAGNMLFKEANVNAKGELAGTGKVIPISLTDAIDMQDEYWRSVDASHNSEVVAEQQAEEQQPTEEEGGEEVPTETEQPTEAAPAADEAPQTAEEEAPAQPTEAEQPAPAPTFDYSTATPAEAADYIYNQSGRSEEASDRLVQNKQKAAQKAYDEVKDKHSESDDDATFDAEEAEYERQRTEAKSQLDYWNGVMAARYEAKNAPAVEETETQATEQPTEESAPIIDNNQETEAPAAETPVEKTQSTEEAQPTEEPVAEQPKKRRGRPKKVKEEVQAEPVAEQPTEQPIQEEQATVAETPAEAPTEAPAEVPTAEVAPEVQAAEDAAYKQARQTFSGQTEGNLKVRALFESDWLSENQDAPAEEQARHRGTLRAVQDLIERKRAREEKSKSQKVVDNSFNEGFGNEEIFFRDGENETETENNSGEAIANSEESSNFASGGQESNNNIYSAVSPYLQREARAQSEADRLRDTKIYQQYIDTAVKIAKLLGLDITNLEDVRGGYKMTEGENAGKKIVEPSQRFVFADAPFWKVRIFTMLLGDLSPQPQEAVITLKYGEDKKGAEDADEFVEHRYGVKDVDSAVKSLHKIGIYDFSIDEDTKVISILEFEDPIDTQLNLLENELKETDNYDEGRISQSWDDGFSCYDTRARRLETYKEWLSDNVEGASDSETSRLQRQTIDSIRPTVQAAIDVIEGRVEGRSNKRNDEGRTDKGRSRKEAQHANVTALTQGFFSNVVNGKAAKYIPNQLWEPLVRMTQDMRNALEAWLPFDGGFSKHINTSIPLFREIQLKKMDAIAKYLSNGGTVIDLCCSQGDFIKAIATLNPEVKGIGVDVNGDMEAEFNKKPVDGTTFVRESVGSPYEEGGVTYQQFKPKEKADVVHETMGFQFITDERQGFVDDIADNMVKEDGIVILEEKVHPRRPSIWWLQEKLKDNNFKDRYYTEEQVKAKDESVVVGMADTQAFDEDLTSALRSRFAYVAPYWQAGNFKGYVATNSRENFNKFMGLIGDNTQNEFTIPENNSEQSAEGQPMFREEEIETPTESTQTVSDKAQELGKELGVEVEVIEDVNTITHPDPKMQARMRKAKGWYDRKTGKVVIVAQNNTNTADVEKTILHEIVGHKGLRKVVGRKAFNTFLDKVFNRVPVAVRDQIMENARRKYNGNYRVATEEYLASFAERGFADRQGTWNKIKNMFLDIIRARKFEKGGELTDKDIQYILWRSYQVQSGQSANIFGRAADMVMRRALNIDESKIDPADIDVEEEGEYGDESDILFSMPAPSSIAQDFYNDAVGKNTLKIKEAWVDEMASVEELIRAIDAESDIPLASYENPYIAAILKSSANSSQDASFMGKYWEPLKKVIGDIVSNFGYSVRDIEKYLNAKHGLERNEAFARRDAQSAAVKEFAAERKQAEKIHNDILSAIDERLRNGDITSDEANNEIASENTDYQNTVDDINARQQQREDELYAENRNRDYSGFTELFTLPSDSSTPTAAELEQRAQDYINEFEGKLGADNVDALWGRINGISEFILNTGMSKGLIGRNRYNQLKDRFKYYVPLRGFNSEVAEDAWEYFGGYGSSVEVIDKKAKGRSSAAGNLLGHLGAMAISQINSGNDNLARQQLYYLAMNHPTSLLTINKSWVTYDAAEKKWVEAEPDFTGCTKPKDFKDAIDAFNERMNELQAAGLARTKDQHLDAGLKVTKPNHVSEHGVKVLIGGNEYTVYVNGNPRAAQALNGLLRESAPKLLRKTVGKATKLKSKAVTSLNPDFMISNFERDIISATTISAIKKGKGYTLKLEKNIAANIPISAVFGKNKSKKDRIVGIYALYVKYNNGTLDMTNDRERYFKEFIDNGGETGISQTWNDKDFQEDLETAWSKNPLKSAAQAVGKLEMPVEFLNRGIENAVRFAAYQTSREMGEGIQDSIYDAKEVSVNFNRSGSGAMGNAFFRTWSTFVNPAVQGTWQYLSLLSKEGVFGARPDINTRARALAAFGIWAIIGMMNSALTMYAVAMSAGAGDDDDDFEFDPYNVYANMNSFKRRNYLNLYAFDLFNEKKNRFGQIALPQEVRVAFGVGVIATEYFLGVSDRFDGIAKNDDENLLLDILGQVGAILPIDVYDADFALGSGTAKGGDYISNLGKGFLKGIGGTIGTPLIELAYNEDFIGRKIMGTTEHNGNEPEYKRVLPDTPEWEIEISKAVNSFLGGDEYTRSKVYNPNPNAAEYLAKSFLGGLISFPLEMWRAGEAMFGDNEDMRVPKNYPFVNRLLYEVDNQYDKSQQIDNLYYYYLSEIERTDARFKGVSKDGSKTLQEKWEYINEMMNTPEGKRWYYYKFSSNKKQGEEKKKFFELPANDKSVENVNKELYKAVQEQTNETPKAEKESANKEMNAAKKEAVRVFEGFENGTEDFTTNPLKPLNQIVVEQGDTPMIEE